MKRIDGIFHGECLEFMKGMDDHSVDLIYADPPFNTGREWSTHVAAFNDTWNAADSDSMDEISSSMPIIGRWLECVREMSDESMEGYLAFMALRLAEMKRIMKPTSTIYIHCDDTAGHYMKQLMDGIFGAKAFKGHITWKRSQAQNNTKNHFGRVCDFIFHYSMPKAEFHPVFVEYRDEYHARFKKRDDGDGRGPYRVGGDMQSRADAPANMYEWKGFKPPRRGWKVSEEDMRKMHDDNQLVYPMKNGSFDYSKTITCKMYVSKDGMRAFNLWTDVGGINGNQRERLGYPTQKPIALLERIVSASSSEGDLVFDPFCGSGTTLAAAQKLRRHWLGCDQSEDAVKIATRRLSGVPADNPYNELFG